VSCYPNAGPPNPLLPTVFPETPESLSPQLQEWAQSGWLNIVGGCCGTTPAHIRAIREAVDGVPPRATRGVGIRDPGLGIRDSGSGIRDPGLGIRDSAEPDSGLSTCTQAIRPAFSGTGMGHQAG